MNAKKIVDQLHQRLADAGFKSMIISVEHLTDVQQDLTRLLEQGTLHKHFYNEITSRYGLQWHFEPPVDFQTAKSVFITAIPHPKVSVTFTSSGKTFSTIIPPTYLHDTDEKALNIIATHLENHGYKVCDALLPTKLLAVHCGLARYGKNNIAYIDGWGSFFRLRAYFSDILCTADSWQDVQMMELCEKCVACVKNCPAGAINKNRFLIH
jgi:epoxyqueuosine reductase